MRYLLFVCAVLLFLALANLPIGYYSLLRFVVTIGAVAVVITELEKGIGFWVIAFVIIAILFNPVLPIYLNDKSAWMPIDMIVGILFLIKTFIYKSRTNE